MKYLKRTLTGYHNSEKNEANYCLLSVKEYHDLQDKIKQQEDEILDQYDLLRELREDLSSGYDPYRAELEKAKKEINAKAEKLWQNEYDKNQKLKAILQGKDNTIKGLEEERAQLTEAIENQKGLNKNLKRIMRERANAERDVDNKKTAPGYLMINSLQCYDHIKDIDTFGCNEEYSEFKLAWKSTIITQYSVGLASHLIEDDVISDLLELPLGLDRIQEKQYNGYMDLSEDDGETGCIVYKWLFKANYKTGYWELEFYSNRELAVGQECISEKAYKRKIDE